LTGMMCFPHKEAPVKKHAGALSKATKKSAVKKASAKVQPAERRRASWEVALGRNLIARGLTREEARDSGRRRRILTALSSEQASTEIQAYLDFLHQYNLLSVRSRRRFESESRRLGFADTVLQGRRQRLAGHEKESWPSNRRLRPHAR
jgi:hypothetical protein